jgi:hypothetical protein
VLLLPSLYLDAYIGVGQVPQLSFERLHLLIAPPVDPPLHATRHRDAQIDASRSCKHKKDEEYKTELF